MKAMRLTILTALTLLASSTAASQPATENTDSILDIIDSIKLADAYVFGEGSNADESLAREIAFADMLVIINEMRKDEGKEPIEAGRLTGHNSELTYSRGEKTAVFVYMKTADAMALKNRQRTKIIVDNPAQNSAASQAETPAGAAQQPVVQQPGYRGGDEIVASLTHMGANVDEAAEALAFLKNFQQKKKITNFAKAKSLGEIPDDAFLIIFDRSRKIRAILGPTVDSVRTNLLTRQPDAVTSYSGHGVIWYK